VLSFGQRPVADSGLDGGPRCGPDVTEVFDLHIPLAYIDPGSGSLIIQAVIAGAVAVPIVLRAQVRRAASAIRRVVGPRSERSKE
jgi:hypothetical protein